MSTRGKTLSALLQEAEQLTVDIGAEEDLPRVKRNLQQIAESGQRLLSKAPTAQEQTNKINASILLGSRGFDVSKLSQRLETLNSTKTLDPIEPVWETDIEGFLRNERENTLLAVVEESRNNTFQDADRDQWKHMLDEWDREKEKILESLLGPSDQDFPDVSWKSKTLSVDPLSFQGRSSLDPVEMAYARELYKANESELSDLKCALYTKFYDISKNFNDKSVRDSWSLLKMLLDVPQLCAKAFEYRSSPNLQKALVNQSRSFLERQYIDYMKDLVYNNLPQAQLGGVPGTRKLIESFLKLKQPIPGLEDGLVNGQPLWAVVFYCMRCGDLEAAVETIQSVPHVSDISMYLQEYIESVDKRLSPSSESKLRLVYKKSIRTSSDPYKKAVYCVLGRCELGDSHSQILVKTEDYMWLKLCQVHCDSKNDQLTLSKLQSLLYKDYGESHFDAQRNPHLYFQVLLLTLQFEAALEFLYRIDSLRCHAVHFALALYDQELLHLSNFNSNLLKEEPNGVHRINIGRMVVSYTHKFALTDPREAVEYFYRLKDLRDGRDKNLFYSCISELALESREFEMLLGKIEINGFRKPGCIDKFKNATNGKNEVQEMISFIAAEAESKGQFEDAVRLYDLAQKHNRVLELLCHLMGGVVSAPSPPHSDRHRLQSLSTSIAERYRNLGYTARHEISHTFFLLLDLMQFFDAYHSKKLDDALDIIKQLRLLPLLDDETVDQKVLSFRTMNDLVRQCFPDLLLAVMNILYTQYRQASAAGIAQQQDSTLKPDLRRTAQNLITFAGMIPYQMPGDTNARLVQMEVLMN